jgi:hypothetical protein
MANIARPTKIWDQTLNDWVFLAGVVDTTKSYTYTADQTFPGITATSYNGGAIVGRNEILNGDFSIWQRGTSFSNPGGVYTADRWDLSYDGSGTTRTVSRQTFAPGTSPSPTYQSRYFYRYSRSGGTGGTVDYPLRQRIEDVRTLSGQTVTVSFWAKADAARTFGLDFFQIFGTGGSSSVYVGVGSYPVTTSWQRFTTTVTLPSVVGKTINDIDSALLVSYYCVSSNATWTLDLWGIQLEAGSVATPFHIATANQQTELAACQRYYIRYSAAATNAILAGFGGWITTTIFRPVIQLPVPMRVSPTSVDYSSVAVREYQSASAISVSAVSIDQTSPQQVSLNLTTAARTIGYIGFIQVDNANVNGYLGLSAEF